MFNTQIQLGDLGYLDIAENVPMPLNFGIAEIRDISKRKGAFSKTIEVAGTANNNELLGYLFDVNVSDSSFNINLKQPCTILQNGVPVMNGNLQLISVNKLAPSSFGLDEQVTYSVLVKDGSADFYSTMQEKRLQDLTGFTQYNHEYTLSSITATSAFTVDNAYTYILPWKSSTAYEVSDFAPAIYAKKYFDEIFQQNGFTYTWDSLEDCDFHKLVIPYNGDVPQVNNELYNFRAGFETGSTDNLVVSASTIINGPIAFFPFTGPIAGFGTSEEQLIFDDDTTSPPNFDNGNNYNSVTSTYVSNVNSTIEFKTKYNFQVDIISPVNAIFLSNDAGATNPSFNIRLSTIVKESGGFEIVTPFYNDSFQAVIIGINSGTTFVTDGNTGELSALFDMYVGNSYEVSLRADFLFNGVWYASGTTTPLTQAEIPYINISTRIDPTDYKNNSFSANLSGILNEGQLVEMENFIPKKIKQKDFIKGVATLYNLFITPDPDNQNNLIIETRNDYYDSGNILDWTSKLNINNNIRLDFLPDLQDKRLTLTYKQDKDEWNTQYELATGEIYGQVEYTFETEFTQSNKQIETIFSPTPIVINSNGLLVPAIVNKNPKNNIRLLIHNGWVDGRWFYNEPLTSETSFLSLLTTYPQALHLDDPFNPTIDINFEQPDYFYYSNYETVTNNNLYNKYWSRFVNQIETGKLMTATFYLNEADIQGLDLRDKIWVHDSYWNINRIIDYNGNGNGLTKVELISVDEGLKFEPTVFNRNDVNSGVVDVGPKNNWINNLVSLQQGPSQNTFGTIVTNTPVLGDGNLIQGGTDSSLILGNNNNYSGISGIVVGDDNNVQGNNLFVFGGSGLTITGDSQAIFNVPVSATTISATTIFVGGSATPIEAQVMIPGTSGTDSVRQVASLTDATGDAAFATGIDTFATGNNSASFNDQTIASGVGASAFGAGSQAQGDYSHAEGILTIASGNHSHSEGNATTASGLNSHAEGNGTLASGLNSHAEGIATEAIGINCHAEGNGSIAGGFASHAAGNESRTSYDGEFASSALITGLAGESQYGTVDGAVTTNNATPTNLDFLGAGALANGWSPNPAVLIGGDIACSFTYQMVCFNDTTNDARLITGSGLIKWIGGTPTLVFATIPTNVGDIGLAAVTATPVASGNGLQFQVTGIAATVLRWKVRVDYNY
jgi:hypothetical protein